MAKSAAKSGLSRHAPTFAVMLSLPAARNTWAVTAIGMWGYAPFPITGALVHVWVMTIARLGLEVKGQTMVGVSSNEGCSSYVLFWSRM